MILLESENKNKTNQNKYQKNSMDWATNDKFMYHVN